MIYYQYRICIWRGRAALVSQDAVVPPLGEDIMGYHQSTEKHMYKVQYVYRMKKICSEPMPDCRA